MSAKIFQKDNIGILCDVDLGEIVEHFRTIIDWHGDACDFENMLEPLFDKIITNVTLWAYGLGLSDGKKETDNE